MIADVLVHVDNTAAGKRRLAYAVALAERHRARLTGLHVTPPPVDRPNQDVPVPNASARRAGDAGRAFPAPVAVRPE